MRRMSLRRRADNDGCGFAVNIAMSFEPASDVRRAMECLRVQLSQHTVDLHVPDKITDDFDPLHSVVRKFGAEKFFFDQYNQLKLIEGIKVKIVSEVRFIGNSFDINS